MDSCPRLPTRGMTREDAFKLVLSQSDHQMLTRGKYALIKYHFEPPPKFEVPESLYIRIRLALKLKQELKTNPDLSLRLGLNYREEEIHTYAEFYKANGHLPSDWKYDPESAISYVPFKRPPVAFKKKPKERPRNPHFDSAPLVSTQKTLWRDFENISHDTTTLAGLPFPTDEKMKTTLDNDNEFVSFIRDFAVGVFNKSYQMYFDKDKNNNISDAKVTECKYIKVRPCYLFYMTIEAVEQEKLGVYEIELRCNLEDGAIVLDSFVLRDPKPSGKKERVITGSTSKTVTGKRKRVITSFGPIYETVTGKRTSAITSLGHSYETVKDDSTDPEDYYEFSGMMCRTVGGYDYYNPCGWNSCWMC